MINHLQAKHKGYIEYEEKKTMLRKNEILKHILYSLIKFQNRLYKTVLRRQFLVAVCIRRLKI